MEKLPIVIIYFAYSFLFLSRSANAQGHRCIKCPHLECHKNGSFFASFDNRDQVKVVHQEDDEPDDPVSECLSPRVKVNGTLNDVVCSAERNLCFVVCAKSRKEDDKALCAKCAERCECKVPNNGRKGYTANGLLYILIPVCLVAFYILV
ncbi:uncharacterized protein LOC26527519 [Drosophila mojavensis]|uniref:DUF753 domain-containing protein n=1 Tax=Drosophila mojavensis TaxID=7230 RepID=A0A0Q9XH51_DROMO|nr:uncharacterized protein LOC26527519 [Drosophila mojavensis]KRG02936.1 uncharacterized protein Dmoj_GI25878 [Drosophila mojavensis]